MDTLAMFGHDDLLSFLNKESAITEKINYLHELTRERFPCVDRVSVAVYDDKCDLLKVFSHSTDRGNPLPYYQARLSDAKSLKKIIDEKKPRVVNDLSVFSGGKNKHTKKIKAHGFQSSYTVPLFHDSTFIGFLFFNSRQKNVFSDSVLSYLDMIAKLVSLLLFGEISEVKTLHGALRTATEFTSHRDPETGAHLDRMARYVHLIAREAAGTEGFNEEMVERLFWYAPLHDVGKIAIPDSILLKNGRLTNDEFEIMKTHTDKGAEIVYKMLENFHLNETNYIPQLINIVRHHHENIDGSGYPMGLKGTKIPVEARIVAVADVFDALTTERPYKNAWSNDEAFIELWKLTNWKLDSSFVSALEKNRDVVIEIQNRFMDEPIDKI
ncbi:MAG: HD-GYP domain-containing protein [Sedimenticola sp.]